MAENPSAALLMPQAKETKEASDVPAERDRNVAPAPRRAGAGGRRRTFGQATEGGTPEQGRPDTERPPGPRPGSGRRRGRPPGGRRPLRVRRGSKGFQYPTAKTLEQRHSNGQEDHAGDQST